MYFLNQAQTTPQKFTFGFVKVKNYTFLWPRALTIHIFTFIIKIILKVIIFFSNMPIQYLN